MIKRQIVPRAVLFGGAVLDISRCCFFLGRVLLFALYFRLDFCGCVLRLASLRRRLAAYAACCCWLLLLYSVLV